MGKQWTDREVEELLRRAVGRSVPDIYTQVAQAQVSPLLNPDDIVPAPAPRPRRRWRRLALALCALLVLVLGVGSFLYFNTAAIISIGSEPDVELSVNRFGRVLSAGGESGAGQAILAGLSLQHEELDDALDQVVAAMAATGYLDSGEDVPVRVDGGDWKYNRELLSDTCQRLEEAAGDAGSGSHFVAQEDAAAQGNASLPAATSSPAPTAAPVSTPSAAPTPSQYPGAVPSAAAATPTPAPAPSHASSHASATLTAEQAQAAALSAAGLSAGDVLFEQVELDWYQGTPHYDLEFVSGHTEYEYEVDAVTGTVLTQHSASMTADPSVLAAQEAGQTALQHAGYAAGEVQDLEVELDEEDGALYYQVEFKAGGIEYEYEIGAYDGSIYKAEQD